MRVSFEDSTSERNFSEQCLLHNQSYNCNSCYKKCEEKRCDEKHWMLPNKHEVLEVSEQQKHSLKIISDNDIQLFMLCERNQARHELEFVHDARDNVIPQLLRLLFTLSRDLTIRLRFFVEVGFEQNLMFTSSQLIILHHFDIQESINVLFDVMLIHISETTKKYIVKRICLEVQRNGSPNELRVLPLQYRIKDAITDVNKVEPFQFGQPRSLPMPIPRERNDIFEDYPSLSQAVRNYVSEIDRQNRYVSSPKLQAEVVCEKYKNYFESVDGQPPLKLPRLEIRANLHRFKVCDITRQLFVIPHYIVRSIDEIDHIPTPDYIILSDVQGNFRDVLLMENLEKFLKHDTVVNPLTCNICEKECLLDTEFELHNLLRCGFDFTCSVLDPYHIELYDRCVRLNMDFGPTFKWHLYGIIQSDLELPVKILSSVF